MHQADCEDMDEIQLSSVRAEFLSAVPVRNFTWMNSDQSAQRILQERESQLDILGATVNSDICKKYPPSLKYQQSFLKSLIQKCEAINVEVVSELYEMYTSLLSKPSSETSDVSFKTYILPGERCTMTLKESVNVISEGTTGLNTWPAACFLVEWAIENKEAFTGRRLLELGSGMGLTGIAVCKMCHPSHYVFSDCHTSVLRSLQDNLTLNMSGTDLKGVTGTSMTEGLTDPHRASDSKMPDISVQYMDWESVMEENLQRYNAGVILATDVVYDTRIIQPLVRLLHLLLCCQGDGKGRPVAFVASTIRNEETYGAFIQALDKQHICMEKVPGPKQQTLHYNGSCTIELLCLSMKTE